MKKLSITLIALLVCLMVSAGKKTDLDLSCLKGQSQINIEFDWSELTIISLPVKDWLEYRQAEQPEYDAYEEFEKQLKPSSFNFITTVNEKFIDIPLALVKKEGCKFTLLIRPLSFDKKGNNTLQCILIDNEKNENVVEFSISGKGGTFGSMSNLWGDGFNDAGKQFAFKVLKSIM